MFRENIQEISSKFSLKSAVIVGLKYTYIIWDLTDLNSPQIIRKWISKMEINFKNSLFAQIFMGDVTARIHARIHAGVGPCIRAAIPLY